MSANTGNPLLARLCALLEERMGLHVDLERGGQVERGIAAAARELGATDLNEFVKNLLSSSISRHELEVLASHVTVGETYFFRDPSLFEALEKKILPALIEQRRGRERRLRIWSAGCATGEEPYSLAIVLRRLIRGLDRWNITVLATDINHHFLARAEKGIYTNWSFRSMPAAVRETYFQAAGDKRWTVPPEVRSMVNFAFLNLAEDNYPSLINGTNAMDIILCRNVLMYFTETAARRVVDKLYRSLVEGGCLIVSPVETSTVLYRPMFSENRDGVTVYRKGPVARTFDARPPPSWEPPSIPEPVVALDDLGTGTEDILDIGELVPADGLEIEEESTRQVGERSDAYEAAHACFLAGDYVMAEKLATGLPIEGVQGLTCAMLLARICANQGRLDEAAEWCTKAIEIDKLEVAPYLLLASIDQERGRLNEAEISLKRTLYLQPSMVVAHLELGNMARLRGRSGEAERHLANAASLLDAYEPDDILPQSEGITAGRLSEIIGHLRLPEAAA